jgi:hypothetical protein
MLPLFITYKKRSGVRRDVEPGGLLTLFKQIIFNLLIMKTELFSEDKLPSS